MAPSDRLLKKAVVLCEFGRLRANWPAGRRGCGAFGCDGSVWSVLVLPGLCASPTASAGQIMACRRLDPGLQAAMAMARVKVALTRGLPRTLTPEPDDVCQKPHPALESWWSRDW